MQLIDNLAKDEWNKFVGSLPHSQFLQSWEWGELQPPARIKRLGVMVDDELAAVIFFIKNALPSGRHYYYAPRGPVFKFSIINSQFSIDILNFLLEEIEKIAKEDKAIFLRIEPVFKILDTKYKILNTIDIQPSKTIILDLTKPEGEILAAMHQKTRYNIKLAEKKGVKIIIGNQENFKDFWQLMRTTANRDGFRLHTEEHYHDVIFKSNGLAKLLLAYYKNDLVAGNILSFFSDTATYVHGASANIHREAMAPYALQWESIKTAQARGCRYYDFYGINERLWPGVTRFKRGYGGVEKEYPGTFDVIFDSLWYNIYQTTRKIKRLF